MDRCDCCATRPQRSRGRSCARRSIIISRDSPGDHGRSLGLYGGLALFSGLLALLAAALHSPWFWLAGLLLQAAMLVFAGLQKAVRANYFLGLEKADTGDERMLALYKGLPVTVLGLSWYTLEEVTELSERMISAIAAESILWRNISEIEAHATLGKIYAEYKLFEQAAAEWEEIPLRNLLIRENIVVQLGRIYFGRDELLRAIKLWEQLPPARLAHVSGLSETIHSAKVRVGHLAARLYRQAHEHAEALALRLERVTPLSSLETTAFLAEIEAALRFNQDLRDLLAYEQRKREGAEGADDAGENAAVYRRMDILLTTRREELHELLHWAQTVLSQPDMVAEGTPLTELTAALHLTPAEISRALEAPALPEVREFTRIARPSRNTLYRLALASGDSRLPASLVAKVYEDTQIAFFRRLLPPRARRAAHPAGSGRAYAARLWRPPERTHRGAIPGRSGSAGPGHSAARAAAGRPRRPQGAAPARPGDTGVVAPAT